MIEVSIFISSKMQELADERQMLFDFLPTLDNGIVQLKPWGFEKDAPASDKSIREVYLEALKNSALYIGIFWNEYGEWTIDEFDRAEEWNIPRHIYVKDVEANRRDPHLKAFLEKHQNVEGGITAKWFKTEDELKQALVHSINTWIYQHIVQRPGDLRARLFHTTDELHELPAYFVGREKELQESQDFLRGRGARLLLQGFGGEGKTALAAKIASDYLSEEATTSVLWLRLGSSSLDAAYEALAAPFEASQAMAKALGDDKQALMAELLQSKKVSLLVLDDAWDDAVLRSLSLAIPHDIPVLMTARYSYPVGIMIELSGLLSADAVDLLKTLSDTVDNEDKAYAICKKLGYLAFAIEVAGRTMHENQWSSSDMLQRLQSSHTLEMPYEYRQSGRESVAVLLEQSILSLRDEARKTFQALGAFFAPSITAELMALYQHPDTEELPIAAIQNTLDELRRRALVRYNPANDDAIAFYKVHDLAYSYAATQLSDKERTKALETCLTYTKRYNEPSRESFAALVPEIDNFMDAATFAMQQERYDDVMKFAGDLFVKSEVLSYRGYYRQAVDLLQQAVLAAKKVDKKQKQCDHLGNLGIVYRNLGQYHKSIDYLQQALMIAEEIGDIRAKGNRLGSLGNVYDDLGQHDKAIDYLQQALDIQNEIGNKRGQGTQLGNIGAVYASLGQYDKAIDYYQRAMAINQELGNRASERVNIGNLGGAYYALGQYDNSINYFQQSLAIAEEIGDIDGKGRALGNLGSVYERMGRYEQAIDYHEQALAIFQKIGDKSAIGSILGNLGNVYDDLGQYNKSSDLHKQALVIAKEIGDVQGEGYNLNNLGEVYDKLEDYDKAIDYFEQALLIRKELGNPRDIEETEKHLESVKQKRDGR